MNANTDTAIFFQGIMNYLWGDHVPPPDYITIAVGDKLRGNARLNHENALDVLDHAFTPMVEAMHVHESTVEGEHDVAIFTVKFVDGSSCLIVAKRGIGSEIEVI